MKRLLALIVVMMAVSFFGTYPKVVESIDIGTGIGIDMETEDFEPLIWMCDHRWVFDDDVEPGRATETGEKLKERVENYAFEGEQIEWEVLVMDKNGINKIEHVYVTVGSVQGYGNYIEVNCVEFLGKTHISKDCNARIGEEKLERDDFDSDLMRYYTCTFTVETPLSMLGEYWVTVEVTDDGGLTGSTMDENEYWYFNPVIALSVTGAIDFGIVRPGTIAYSDTLLVENDAAFGSGVLLDMFISGTDFYDGLSSGAMCPISNRLKLGDNIADSDNDGEADGDDVDDNNDCDIVLTGKDEDHEDDEDDHLCYYATNGAYSTQHDPRNDNEGYVGIVYGTSFTTAFYNDAEIIAPTEHPGGGLIELGGIDYFAGNVLTPGAEIAITFKLGLPEPCNGDFSDGSIFFWGEAI